MGQREIREEMAELEKEIFACIEKRRVEWRDHHGAQAAYGVTSLSTLLNSVVRATAEQYEADHPGRKITAGTLLGALECLQLALQRIAIIRCGPPDVAAVTTVEFVECDCPKCTAAAKRPENRPS